MSVDAGVLHKVSGGVTNTTHRWGIREYIDLGDEHIRNVALTNYLDELLIDSLGEKSL